MTPAIEESRCSDRLTRQFRCLLALQQHGDAERAARSCGLTPQALHDELHEAERVYGRPLVRWKDHFDGFTDLGEAVLASARLLGEASFVDWRPPAEATAADEDQLAALLSRRSVSPKRLGHPGPSLSQLDLMLQAALRAPDHGGLHPWRVIEFRSESRVALADAFEHEKRRRDPLASPADLRRAREHATRAPVLLAFVVSPRQRAKVPWREQWLSAGAALCNLLHAAHQLGFGAIMLSGERCHDTTLLSRLGLKPEEILAGFVSIGRILQAPPQRKPVPSGAVWSCWTPPARSAGPLDDAA